MKNALFILLLCLSFPFPGIAEEKAPWTIESFRKAIPIATYSELVKKWGKPDREFSQKQGGPVIFSSYKLPDESRIVAEKTSTDRQKAPQDELIVRIDWVDAKGFPIEQLQESANQHEKFQFKKNIQSRIQEILPEGWSISMESHKTEPFGYTGSEIEGSHIHLYKGQKRIDLWLMPLEYRPVKLYEIPEWMPQGTVSILGRTQDMIVYQFSKEKIDSWPDWKKAITRQLALK